MSKPTLSIAFSNNNLLRNIESIDGVAAFIGTGQQAGNQGSVFIINSLQEAIDQGLTLASEPFVYRHIKEFYTELGGNQRIYVLLLANTVTMAQMLDSTVTTRAVKLIEAGGGSISYLGVFRTPPVGYDGGASYIDADVAAAVTASASFMSVMNAKKKYFRILIEGRISTEASTTVYAPNTASNGFAGVVLGGTKNDLSASVGLALGRKVKYAAHIKIGKVANGALSIDTAFIGTKSLNANNEVTVAAVGETKATSTLTITNAGADGDYIYAYAVTNAGWIFLCSYLKVTLDNTTAKVATAIKDAINNQTIYSGFTATVSAAVVTIIAPTGSGDTMNTKVLEVGTFVLSTGAATTLAYTKTAFTGGVTAKPSTSTLVDSFHDKGYITFLALPSKAGFYYGIDNMCSNDDYRILAHGAVIDAAAKVVTAVYQEQLESEVDTNPDGTIQEIEAAHLEAIIEQQVNVTLGDRISGFTALVDRTVNIINTSKTKVKMKVLPKGYNTYIEVDLGLTAGN